MLATAEKKIFAIPLRNKFNQTQTSAEEDIPKLRVAAYARVSTDQEEQESSYQIQIEHYTKEINSNQNWSMAGLYADEGISGTNTKKRIEFNRMIQDCMDGKIDMVITKSISRFARNTLDCLNYIRKLKDKGIPVIFEKENINSMDSSGEVMLTIMASLAQQESESLSKNVKMGIGFRFQNGEVMVNHNRFMGYTKDENKQLIIVPEEAVVIKRIYREYLEGSSLLQICKSLESDGILTAANKPKWRAETVKKILQNEKYIGDALLQKTYTTDFLNKKRKKNINLAPQFYVENNHAAIIPKELYMQVQEEMARRVNIGTKDKKRVYSGKYSLSSAVFCGDCGEIYRRIHWNNRGKKSIVWRCTERLEGNKNECKSPTLTEERLQSAVLDAINRLIKGKNNVTKVLLENLSLAINEDLVNGITEIDNQIDELQSEIVNFARANKNYDKLSEKIHSLREQKLQIQVQNAERESKRKRVDEMQKFLKENTNEVTEFDDKLVRSLIEKITVKDENLIVEFKSGTTIEV